LADTLAISTQTPDLGIRKEFEQLLDKSHTLITIGVSFLVKHPPQQGERNPFMHHPDAQDVVVMPPKLPGRSVNAEDPRLGHDHPADDELGNDTLVNLKPPKEVLEAFGLGGGLGRSFKTKGQFAQVYRFHFQQR
jgi:hypothetical protein